MLDHYLGLTSIFPVTLSQLFNYTGSLFNQRTLSCPVRGVKLMFAWYAERILLKSPKER
jgi:hypothetical protein